MWTLDGGSGMFEYESSRCALVLWVIIFSVLFVALLESKVPQFYSKPYVTKLNCGIEDNSTLYL
jgi:hypothetical protein